MLLCLLSDRQQLLLWRTELYESGQRVKEGCLTVALSSRVPFLP